MRKNCTRGKMSKDKTNRGVHWRMMNQQCETEGVAFQRIWSHIRDELAFLQDQSPSEFRGQVVNPISGFVYLQNTSCAALVFATEYVRSGEVIWLSRAQLALDSLKKTDVHSGLEEPKWNRLGWHYNKGSLFATGTLLDTFWKTLRVLGLEDDKDNLLRLLRYLETCGIRPGLFAHDSVGQGQRSAPVQNTTAIALYLMEAAASQLDTFEETPLSECDVTLKLLLEGQRSDGFWPYIYPGVMQQLVFRSPLVGKCVRRLPIVRRYFFKGGDSSVFFGDAVHHCLVLYYLVKSIALRQPRTPWMQAVAKGWAWTHQHLIEARDGSLRFDFDWEPAPTGFRYANFRDTSTYFLILAMLPLLSSLGVITEDYHAISEGLLIHIDHDLLQGEGSVTSIQPYEGPDEILRYILPRVGESSAWKGALLAEFILNQRPVGG